MELPIVSPTQEFTIFLIQGQLNDWKYVPGQERLVYERWMLRYYGGWSQQVDTNKSKFVLIPTWKEAMQSSWEEDLLSISSSESSKELRGNCITVTLFVRKFLTHKKVDQGLMCTFYQTNRKTPPFSEFHCANCIFHKDKGACIGITMIDMSRIPPDIVYIPLGRDIVTERSSYYLSDSKNLMQIEGKTQKKWMISDDKVIAKFHAILQIRWILKGFKDHFQQAENMDEVSAQLKLFLEGPNQQYSDLTTSVITGPNRE